MTIEEANNKEINIESFLTKADPLELEEAYKNFDKVYGSIENFIDSNIKYMQQYLIKEISPTPEILKKAYIDYMPILFTLQKLYARCRSDLKTASHKLQLFEDQAYVVTRNKSNNSSTDKKLFLSTKEIESTYRYEYRNHLSTLQAEYDIADGRLSVVRRLLDSWTSFNYILSNLTQLTKTETKVLGTIDFQETNWANGYNN